MPRLKKMVAKYLCIISALMVIVLLAVYISGQIYSANHLAKESANKIFQQMDQMLTQNQNDIEEMKKEYSQTCLHNAETVAYIIQSDPKALDSAEKLKKIAEFVEIDEIHIFDETGRIFTGTNPEYYNLTIDSGEQIRFFKPLLNDKSLKLCQEITPNTAENKMMQYSALWSDNGEYIVQVGMEPVNVMKVTEKNELSYIFSLLRATAEVNLYAIDVETGEIKGSTDVNTVGKNLTEIGLTEEKIKNHSDGFYAEINGVKSYCVFSEAEGNYLGRIVPNKVLYSNIPSQLLGLTGCFMLIAIILVVAVMWYINKYVINGIDSVNEKLRAIAEGDLNEKADVQSSLEFSELSCHINDMIESVLSTTDKISYVLDKTNMRIGVYEYNDKMKSVRFTEYVPKILNLDSNMTERLSSDYNQFTEYIDKLCQNPVPEEKDIYLLKGEKDSYIKMEIVKNGSDTMGIIIDVTDDILKRRQIEKQRDIDLLTGLYNRRGLESNLSELFKHPKKLGYGALIMIDADGLKEINDKYGHENGDIYLKKLAEAICSLCSGGNGVASRQGGDEFVLFIYNYINENELLDAIDTLKYIQNNTDVLLNDESSVPLRFSFGYSLTEGQTDYPLLMKEADKRMYANKKERKKSASNHF